MKLYTVIYINWYSYLHVGEGVDRTGRLTHLAAVRLPVRPLLRLVVLTFLSEKGEE